MSTRRKDALGNLGPGHDFVVWDEIVVPGVVDLREVVLLVLRQGDPRQRLNDSGRDEGLELLVGNALPFVNLGRRARELGKGRRREEEKKW